VAEKLMPRFTSDCFDVFFKKNRYNLQNCPKILIDGPIISNPDQVKYLGVIL